MRIKVLLISVLCLFFAVNSSVAKKKSINVIYKWEQDNMIYYSHIKPVKVTDFIKLDSQGRLIEDFTKEFGELVEIQAAVRPKLEEGEEDKDLTDSEKAAKEIEEEIASGANKKNKQKNCKAARKNMEQVTGGQVYEPNEKGDMILVTGDKLDAHRANQQKNIDFYCNP